MAKIISLKIFISCEKFRKSDNCIGVVAPEMLICITLVIVFGSYQWTFKTEVMRASGYWRFQTFFFKAFIKNSLVILNFCSKLFFNLISDVIVGSILGLVISYLCYRQYYPSVYRSNCHIPYISDNTSRDIELQLIKDHINIP